MTWTRFGRFALIWLATFGAAGALTLVLTRLSPEHLERLQQLPLPLYIFVVNGLVPIVAVLAGMLAWRGRGIVFATLVYKVAFLLYFTSTWPFQLLGRLFPRLIGDESTWLVVGTVAFATAIPAAAAQFMWRLTRERPEELGRSNRLASLGLLLGAVLIGASVEVVRELAPIPLGHVPLGAMAPQQLWTLLAAAGTLSLTLVASVGFSWFYLDRMRSARRSPAALGGSGG